VTAARLELRDVVVAFGGLRAVDGVNITIEPGEVIGFIGPNGSGKTTLLDTISGQLLPQSGHVMLDGEDLIDHLPEDRAELGLVRSFQDARLFPDLTVEDTLLLAEDARRPVSVLSTTFSLPTARRAEAAKRATVTALLADLGLTRFRHQPVSELSTGTRRIVDLAAIIAAQPRLLLLDEPTAGIAQREAEAFGPLLRRLHELTGATICVVEHDVPLVVGLADRLVVMETGKVVSAGSVEEVLQDSAAIAAYLGASQEAIARSGARPSERRPNKAKKVRT
jgi:ABC-type branched-subunit amino acid transport system ATPase component